MGKLFIAMCTLVVMDTLDMAAYANAPPNHQTHRYAPDCTIHVII